MRYASLMIYCFLQNFQTQLSKMASHWQSNLIISFPPKTEHFSKSVFLFALGQWSKLDPKLYNSSFDDSFQKPEGKICSILDDFGIKLLTKLLIVNYLGGHTLRDNFEDVLNPQSSYETNKTHFFNTGELVNDWMNIYRSTYIKTP